MSREKTLLPFRNLPKNFMRNPKRLKTYLNGNEILDDDENEYQVKGRRYDHWFLLCRDAHGDWINQSLLDKSWKRKTKKKKQYNLK